MPAAPSAEGQKREAQALRHLQAAGLRLRAANVRYRFGELDLVMDDGELLVFVEVRYRRSRSHGGAAASIGSAKRQRLWRAAQAFLAANPALAQRPCRFDVLAIEGTEGVQWIRNALQDDSGWG
jgi:putative endonuclease